MKELLYWGVGIVAKLHDAIMQLNNTHETNFTDKELHFLVIGLLGMAMLFVIYPLFKYLAKKKLEIIIAWIYVFTVIVVITFAIEIGQKITNTGHMDFGDIMFGLVGFLLMFAIFVVIRMIYHGIMRFIRRQIARSREKKTVAQAQIDPEQEV